MSQFKGQNSLRSNVLKRALKSYIIPPVLKKYQVIALRALWDDDQPDENRIWFRRKTMEDVLSRSEHVGFFFLASHP